MEKLDGANWLLLSDAERTAIRNPAKLLSERYGFPVDTCDRAIGLLGVTEAESTLRIACEYEVSTARVEYGLSQQERN